MAKKKEPVTFESLGRALHQAVLHDIQNAIEGGYYHDPDEDVVERVNEMYQEELDRVLKELTPVIKKQITSQEFKDKLLKKKLKKILES